MQTFLSPLTGGLPTGTASTGILAGSAAPAGAGWPLGTAVRSQDIEAVATRVPGVRYVDSVLIAAVGADGSVVGSVDPVPMAGLQLPAAAAVFVSSGAGRGPVVAHRQQPARPAHPGARPRRPRGLLIPWTSRAPSSISSTVSPTGGAAPTRRPARRWRPIWTQQAVAPPSAGATAPWSTTKPSARSGCAATCPSSAGPGATMPLDPSARRGAGRDAYGNWYWIDDDQASIRWRPAAGDTSAPVVVGGPARRAVRRRRAVGLRLVPARRLRPR